MITKHQWFVIHSKALGLRSEDNCSSIMGSGASYAMDMGKEYKPNENAPENWERLLRGTIDYMQQFEDFAVRYLMIVCPSRGNSEISEYSGTFPKSSSKATTIVACTKLDDDVDNLVAWVEENIK